MNALTSRHRVNLRDTRQIFSPEELKPEMPIACVTVLRGTTLRERIGRAGFGFVLAGLTGEPEK
jgi:hypothetical protein